MQNQTNEKLIDFITKRRYQNLPLDREKTLSLLVPIIDGSLLLCANENKIIIQLTDKQNDLDFTIFDFNQNKDYELFSFSYRGEIATGRIDKTKATDKTNIISSLTPNKYLDLCSELAYNLLNALISFFKNENAEFSLSEFGFNLK